MHRWDLHIGMGGLPSEVRTLLTGTVPLDRFEHQYTVVENEAALLQEKLNIFIFDESFAVSLAVLRKLRTDGVKCVLCSRNPGKEAPEKLGCLAAVWTKPLGPVLLGFYVHHLQMQMREEKQHLLCRNYLETTINMVPDLIWYKDTCGAHIKVNDAFCKLVGKTRDDIEGRGHYYVWGLTQEQYERGEYVCLDTEETVLREKKVCRFDEQVLSGKNLRELRTYKAPLFDEDGNIFGTVGVAHDVTQERKYERQILDMARTDDLTGLANRRYFYSYLGRHRGKKRLAILYCDLDGFKELNDNQGHHAGDEALITVGRLLKKRFPDALVARFGGDEFLLALIGGDPLETIRERIEEVQAKLHHTFDARTKFDGLSMSVGIAVTDDVRASIDSLIQQSDRALYEAKRNGKGTCRVYTAEK